MGLINLEPIVIIKKNPGTRIKGHYIPGSITATEADANSQPLNGEELQLLEEGDRVKSTRKFYSEYEIKENNFIRRSKENVAQVDTCSVDTVLDSTDYTCTINGTIFTYNSGIGATALSIVDGIVTEIQGGSEPINVVDNLNGTYTITSSIVGTEFTLSVDTNQSFDLDVANVRKQYRIMQVKDYSDHNIPHYKGYGVLDEENV